VILRERNARNPGAHLQRIINEVEGVNSDVDDTSGKPPDTIEEE
jgi:GMP synthase PP-ATPase subunit